MKNTNKATKEAKAFEAEMSKTIIEYAPKVNIEDVPVEKVEEVKEDMEKDFNDFITTKISEALTPVSTTQTKPTRSPYKPIGRRKR